MKVSTEIDNNFGYEKITQLVDNIPLKYAFIDFLYRSSLHWLNFPLLEMVNPKYLYKEADLIKVPLK